MDGTPSAALSLPGNPKLELKGAGWWAVLILIVVLATALRLTGIKFGLPYHEHPDEPAYFAWAARLRTEGTLQSTTGGQMPAIGYPPAYLWTLVGEQAIIKWLTDAPLDSPSYYLVARHLSALAGGLAVAVAGLAGRKLSTPLGGLLAAAIIAVHPAHVQESRIASANALWVLFTLLSFYLVLRAKQPLTFPLLYAALAAGILAMLFKYQSAPIMLLPFLVAMLHGRANRSRLGWHLLIMTLVVAAVLAWLFFVYDIRSIDKLPDSEAAGFWERGTLLAFPALMSNIRTTYTAMGEALFWVSLALGLASGAVGIRRRLVTFDWEGAFYAGLFAIGLILLLSLFASFDASKLLPALIMLDILWAAAVACLAAFLSTIVRQARPSTTIPGGLMVALEVIVVLALALPTLSPDITSAVKKARQLTLEGTYGLTGDWFIENVPQGARITAEHQSHFNAYAGFPGPSIYNAKEVDSIFERSIEEYQASGIEYLIVKQISAQRGGYFSDPERPGYAERLEIAAEFTPEGRRGTHTVIFALPPIQQHVRYLWLGDPVLVGQHDVHPISFRGYDLPRSELKPGFVLEFTLYWMSVVPTGVDYVVDARLTDPGTGQIAAQHESQPDSGHHPTSEWPGDMQFFPDKHLFVLPADLRLGVYDLEIALYDGATGDRLPVTDLDGEPLGDSFSLGEITITG